MPSLFVKLTIPPNLSTPLCSDKAQADDITIMENGYEDMLCN